MAPLEVSSFRTNASAALFSAILPQQGIKVNFTPVNDSTAVEKAINGRIRAIYIETVGNPGLDVADIEEYAVIAKKHHLSLIVDSTFMPPTLRRPIEHGTNIVIHSLSKWIGGHGMAIGVKGGAAEAQKLVDIIDLFTIIANVGDAKSLIIHPASTTHSQLSEEDQIKAGLPPELIRLSIGLENKDDIITALDDALNKI